MCIYIFLRNLISGCPRVTPPPAQQGIQQMERNKTGGLVLHRRAGREEGKRKECLQGRERKEM